MGKGQAHQPNFSVFGVFNYLFKIDWLHCADQGVSADFLGNEFDYLVQKKLPGSNATERCKVLHNLAMDFYSQNGVEDQLKGILPKTYKSEKKSTAPPKLKGNAASTRALVPFGKQLAQRCLSDTDPFEHGIKTAAHHLNNCYQSLGRNNRPFSHQALYNSSKNFALQYGALFKACGDGVKWRPMPKMHLFLELCSSKTEPSLFWNYRDEDFGGSVARQSRMKGMWKRLSAYSKHGLDLFKMKNPTPRIVD